MNRFLVLSASSVSLVALVLSACSRPPAPLPPRPMAGIDADSLARLRADSLARADSLRKALAREQQVADSMRALQEREQRESAQQGDAMKILLSKVYFDYDQSTLTEAARELLDAKIPVLRAHPEIRLLITGHTDDRGSTEYNIALGLRRAYEIQAYLIASGIDAERLEVTSMGSERPAVMGSGEIVWSQNRRAEFSITKGAPEGASQF